MSNQSYLLVSAFLLVSAASATAQLASDSTPNQTINISVSAADKMAASQATTLGRRMILPPKAGYGVHAAPSQLMKPAAASSNSSLSSGGDDFGTLPGPGYYPGDLSNPTDGPVITDMVSHPLYVNTAPATVGNPGTLLRDLGKSDYVHVLDQYVGRYADDRYKVGIGALVTTSPAPSGPFYDSDIQSIVHAAALAFGKSGYHFEYHVFLAPGQDLCFADAPPLVCYSPDNYSNFYFCAYHSSVVFSDIGEVIYSAIPYQNVGGCQVGSPSPNGLVIDSTMSVLAHEFAESISDPDGDAWLNYASLDLFLAEVGDICQNPSFVYPVVSLNGTKYELQALYSNKYHGCAYVP